MYKQCIVIDNAFWEENALLGHPPIEPLTLRLIYELMISEQKTIETENGFCIGRLRWTISEKISSQKYDKTKLSYSSN